MLLWLMASSWGGKVDAMSSDTNYDNKRLHSAVTNLSFYPHTFLALLNHTKCALTGRYLNCIFSEPGYCYSRYLHRFFSQHLRILVHICLSHWDPLWFLHLNHILAAHCSQALPVFLTFQAYYCAFHNTNYIFSCITLCFVCVLEFKLFDSSNLNLSCSLSDP